MTPSPMLNTSQAAELLAVPRYQVVRWILAGAIPATRIGRRWWITAADLERFVNGEQR